MIETPNSPEKKTGFSSWEEFEMSVGELIDDFKDESYRIRGNKTPLPVSKEIPYETVYGESGKRHAKSYYYEFDETESGFFIRVRRSKNSAANPETWPMIDTAPILGVKLPEVSEYVLRFHRSDEETGKRAGVSLLLNPSLLEYRKNNSSERRKDGEPQHRRHLTTRGLRQLVEDAESVGELPIWHPARPDVNLAERARNFVYFITRR